MGRRSATDHLVLAISIAAAATALALQLIFEPIVGLANNGDFLKVMGYAGFQYPPLPATDLFYSWIQSRFVIAEPGWYKSGYLTSETLLALIGRGLVAAMPEGGHFDVRVLGALHATLFLLSAGMILWASRNWPVWLRVVAAALFLLVFTDVGYAAPFNSFYSQTASLIFLLLTIGAATLILSSDRAQGAILVLYFAFAALLVASKPQASIQAPLLAAYGVRLSILGQRRERILGWTLAVALGLFALWYNLQTPPDYRRLAKYGAVFGELLPASPTPADDLRELGLDPKWARFAGQPAFPPDFPGETFQQLSYGRLLLFYVSHPARLASLMGRAAPSAFELRPPALGNFEKATGLPPRAKSDRFSMWSELRARAAAQAVTALFLLLGAALAASAIGYRRSSGTPRLAREGIFILSLMAVAEFAVCTLADSLVGLPRHLYLFQALTDVLLLCLILRGLIALAHGSGGFALASGPRSGSTFRNRWKFPRP